MVDPIFQRQLALYEALRRIGFKSEELFVTWNHSKPATIIRVDDKQQFSVDIGITCVLTQKEYEAGWAAAAEWWNTKMTDIERMAIYKKYFDVDALGELILALKEKQMPLRRVPAPLGDQIS